MRLSRYFQPARTSYILQSKNLETKTALDLNFEIPNLNGDYFLGVLILYSSPTRPWFVRILYYVWIKYLGNILYDLFLTNKK